MRDVLRHFGWDLSRPGGRLVPWRLRRAALPADLQRLIAPGGTVELPLRACASALGFSLADDGWSPYVATLHEWVERPDLVYEETALGRLHARYRPSTMQEALLDHVSEPLRVVSEAPAWFVTRVWIARRHDVEQAVAHGQRGERARESNGGSWYYAPPTAAEGWRQFGELQDLHRTITRHGYAPGTFDAPPITGYFLVDGDRWRFIVTDGQHRTAVLRHLGADRIRARLWGGPAGVDAARLAPWTEEHGGPYPEVVARLLHHQMLVEEGLAKAERLGVDDVRPNRELVAGAARAGGSPAVGVRAPSNR